jgi:hypothetical protein
MDKEYFIKSGIAICTAVGIKSGGEKVTAEMFSSKEVFDGLVEVGSIELKEVQKVEPVKVETPKVDDLIVEDIEETKLDDEEDEKINVESKRKK